ncbi:double-strand break repair protein AddB [Lutibaculum baratangense]|uniref:ATP-dependent nuclease subunit B n=1 Tax=Lutibaculum baratangense AMV1 TaxID=631454 RepID=V4RS96_9HYPH|nr:double-strand break repair protein AddB [Lutibaculum baratangense]ESR26000.1 ATP-dependent nuclease subunit B [Lutibaculum baratangense AMV1]
MTERPAAPRIRNVPPTAPFLPTLADALMDGRLVPPRGDGSPHRLEDHLVLLPTRRACRALAEELLDRAEGRATLLPRIRPIGDVDEVELALGGAFADPAELEIPPAIPPLTRQMLLTRLVLAWGRSTARELQVPGREEPVAVPVGPGDAAHLARDLGTLLDDFAAEGQDLGVLATLVSEDHADYWRITLEFLKIATETWPAVLGERGMVDPAARRDALLAAQGQRFLAAPPATPVIAAGSTAALRSTQGLLGTIARLPYGAVVLPGLDQFMDEEAWSAIDAPGEPLPGHPQFRLKRFVTSLGLERKDVEPLVATPAPSRERLIAEVFRPAGTTERWAMLRETLTPLEMQGALEGLTLVTAESERDEALSVALILREALETPGRTAALVTPDRSLARRVCAELVRWEVEVDDSAGVPLGDTPPGTLLRLIADAAANAFSPGTLVPLLQHPLVRLGLEEAEIRRRARALELAVLRGPRPGPGLAGLEAAAAERRHEAEARKALSDGALERWQAVEALIGALKDAVRPIEALERGTQGLAAIAEAHLKAYAALSALPEGEEPRPHEADATMAQFVAELMEAAPEGPDVTLREYPNVLSAMLSGRSVRPLRPGHPRLQILGPIEARLLSADLVVLGGLNEGTWPEAARTAPFLNRPMRAGAGLEAPERFVGLAAHDVAQLMSLPHVVATRTTKAGGQPTVASRWLQRLKAVIGAETYEGLEAGGRRYTDWAHGIDLAPTFEPFPEPRPTPPRDLRPGRLRVSEIETLIRDPYAIYARRILRLDPLDPLEQEPDAAARGSLIHDALASYVQAVDRGERPGRETLLAIGTRRFEPLSAFPEITAYWWPRFERLAAWFAAVDEEMRADAVERLTETEGRTTIAMPEREIDLVARADRIDRLKSRGLRIIDYKTGSPPSAAQMQSGLAPQLPLEGAIALAGGFGDALKARPIAALEHIQATGRTPPGLRCAFESKEATTEEVVQKAWGGLLGLLESFERETTPYLVKPRAKFASRWTEYDHLSRVAEWSVSGEGDGNG